MSVDVTAEAAVAAETAATRITRIRPTRSALGIDLRELWAYHELLFFLVWRDIKVKYKQTAIGIVWAVIQPLMAMILFSVIFGHLAKIKPEQRDIPYPLFVFAGLLPWTYFSASLTMSSTSLVGNANLITKVYFPRLIIPLASIFSPLIDFFFAFMVLIGLFAWYGRAPDWHAVAIPAFLGVALLTAFGVGLWLSSLNVRYRDIPYAIPFLTQLWLYATPVIYPVSMIPRDWRWLIALNPMTGVVEAFRWSVLGSGVPHYAVFGVSSLVGLCLTASGLWYFRRTERHFADII